ncbi:MAG: hypothetical protein J6Z12_05840 [Paludibacteraceae bacterium]|nr:hypothetical protein [Paludibacteraceae bacterium]
MVNRFPFVFILIGLFFAVPSRGQDVSWSMMRCVEYARIHNLSIKQKQLELDLSREDVRSTKAAFAPSLSA